MCRRERSSRTSAATCKPPGWRGLGERPPYRAISRALENNRVSTPRSADSSRNLPPSTYLARERTDWNHMWWRDCSQEDRRMLLYLQTWLPLLTITLTAAIFFGVASFIMARARA